MRDGRWIDLAIGIAVMGATQAVVGLLAFFAMQSLPASRLRDDLLVLVWPAVVLLGGLAMITLAWRWSPSASAHPEGTGRGAKPRSRPEARRPSRETAQLAERPREIIDIAVGYLPSLFTPDRSVEQVVPLVEPYLGKWIHVTGRVAEVNLGEDARELWIGSDEVTLLVARFDGEWTTRLAVLPLGQPIRVLGRIESAFEMGLILDRCELVEDKAPEASPA